MEENLKSFSRSKHEVPVSVGEFATVRFCRFSGKPCFYSSCDFFDCSSCSVNLCAKHGNPRGRFLPRKFVSGSGF